MNMEHSTAFKVTLWIVWFMLIMSLAIPIWLGCMVLKGSIGAWEIIAIIGLIYVIYDIGKTVVQHPPWK